MDAPDRIDRDREREVFETRLGPVRLYEWCTPAFVAGLELGEGLGVFPAYRSIFATPEALARVAGAPGPSNLLLGLDRDDAVVGYCAFKEPPADDFWGRLGPGTLYEIAALEVSREYRGVELGKRLLHLGLTDPIIEDRITYMVGYSWTWDLEGTGLAANEYRQILINLLTPYGFRRYPTNEPNVSLRPENIFMARIGANVDEEVVRRFKNLLFGIV